METISTSLAFCEGNPPVTGGIPSQRPVTQSFDVFFDLPEQTIEQTIETLVIWDAIALLMTPLLTWNCRELIQFSQNHTKHGIMKARIPVSELGDGRSYKDPITWSSYENDLRIDY